MDAIAFRGCLLQLAGYLDGVVRLVYCFKDVGLEKTLNEYV